MDITKEGALNDFWSIKPTVSVEIKGNTVYFTSELHYAEEDE